jgi:RNA polymerase sigma-70 factor (ECF subfamily)
MAAASPVIVDPVLADFGSIYERNREYVRRIASRFVRDISEAEDIAQESFARAYAAIGNYRGDASISTWLTRITINTAIETLRAGKRKVFEKSVGTPPESEDDAPAYEFIESRPDPERRLFAKQQMQQVIQSLESLSPYQRKVFELRFFDEKSLNEIAEITGRSLSSTKTAIFRARVHVLEALHASEVDTTDLHDLS